MTSHLGIIRGVGLYVGALLGPGVLLLPGLAAAQAGPASILAWGGLLVVSGLIAIVFARMGLTFPSASGVRGYAEQGLGPTVGRAVSWCFLAGTITGAPIVCVIGGNYVAALLGGGRVAATVAATALLVGVLCVTATGVRTSSAVQVVLVALLIVLVVAAVAGSAGHARAANWTPFAPHGWIAIGSAASTLMLSFVGWEAVAPLTARFARPRRQLPAVIGIAFALTSLIYLALAAVTVGVLGAHAGSGVPLAALLETAIGAPGRIVAAIAAVLLTLGTTNAYLSGASTVATTLVRTDRRMTDRFPSWLVIAIVATGVCLIALIGFGVLSVDEVVTIPTTFFLGVYLGCTVSAVRVLRGIVRWLAAVATAAVAAVLLFCGLAMLPVVLVAGVAAIRRPRSPGCYRPVITQTGQPARLKCG